MNENNYYFNNHLQEAKIVKRETQFTIKVNINNKVETCHCPVTSRIGNVDLNNISCLVSSNKNNKRKLLNTIEAVSFDKNNEN